MTSDDRAPAGDALVAEQDLPRPHAVMIVANDVKVDTRVRKMASALSDKAYKVTVLGISPIAVEQTTTIGNANVRLLPVGSEFRDHGGPSRPFRRQRREDFVFQIQRLRREFFLRQRDVGALIGRLRQDYFEDRKKRIESLNEWEASRKAALTRRSQARMGASERVKRDSGFSSFRRVVALIDRVDRRLSGFHKSWRVRSHERREARIKRRIDAKERAIRNRLGRELDTYETKVAKLKNRIANLTPRLGRRLNRVRWETELPMLHDYDAAFSPVLDDLSPDIIHVHDIHLLGIAARAVSRAFIAGHQTKLIYDAHEYIQGLATALPRLRAAWSDLESTYIRQADRVITVSPPLAELLVRDYGLAMTPDVILNVPDIGKDTPYRTVRSEAGVDADTPLVVYSGGVSEARGVHVLVEAMGSLEDVHLAIVSKADTNYVLELKEIARAGEFSDRFHLVPFVSPREVVSYLATADLAVHPMDSAPINHQIALPNKLFEYMHAGLPVVVSDCKAMADFVHQNSIGEVFNSGDAGSLAESIGRVLGRIQLDRHAYSASKEILDRYSWDSQRQALVDIYDEVTGRVG